MKSTTVFAAATVCLACLIGCGPSRSTTLTTAPSVTTVDAQSLGAVDWLRDVSTLEATALITTYDATGAAHVSASSLKVDVDAGKLRARCNIPGGWWKARISLDGWSLTNPIGWDSLRTGGDARLTRAEREQIIRNLRLILHRLRGPINLLRGGGERIVDAAPTVAGARDLTRVLVTGRPLLVSAYFFERNAPRLRMIAQDGYEPGQPGTVTLYETRHTTEGAVLPVGLDVRQLGLDTLTSQRRVLSVRLKDVSLR